MTEQAWQPGDPLYSDRASGAGASYRHYIFNFRYDGEGEQCSCGDAASWPEPRGGQSLGYTDEIEAWLKENRLGRNAS